MERQWGRKGKLVLRGGMLGEVSFDTVTADFPVFNKMGDSSVRPKSSDVPVS